MFVVGVDGCKRGWIAVATKIGKHALIFIREKRALPVCVENFSRIALPHFL